MNKFVRTERIFGKEAMEKLAASKVAVFGIGGVGSYASEALVRSGIGQIDIIDSDKVDISNINRQIFATFLTVGMYKVDAAKERFLDINPEIKVNTYKTFFLPENADMFDFKSYDYIVDAIDTVSGKIALALEAQKAGTPIISSMGTGNKIDPTALEVADIYETSVCPLARVMRRELKKRSVERLKVVYSKETPKTSGDDVDNEPASDSLPDGQHRKRAPGSCAFVPPAAGLIIAGEVIRDLTGLTV